MNTHAINSLLLALVFVLSGCVWPGIDNRKQGPLDNRTVPAPATNTIPVAPQAMAVTSIKNASTAIVYWPPVSWGRQVSYIVGWGLAANAYTSTANTGGTNYLVSNLKPGTLYYFSVKTIDVTGLQSDWAQWYHYTVPKTSTPGKLQPALSTAQ